MWILKDKKLLVSLISFGVLIFTFLYFYFTQNPIDIFPGGGNILGTQKEGVIVLESPQNVSVNLPFDVIVKVDTQNQKVNAVGFTLKFSPQHLEMIDFDTSQSFCQFYPEKKFDNIAGKFILACGSPHPGFSGETVLAKLKFMPKLVSKTNLFVDPSSQILLSDGKGTNILTEHPVEQISILNNL